MKKNILKELNSPAVILLASVLTAGLFYEFLSCAAAAVLCGYLLVTVKKNKRFIFNLNLCGITVITISLFYLTSSFWAIDSGMAIIGFVKFLPLPLFLLAVMQTEKKPIEYVSVIPPAALLMTVISAVLQFIPALKEYIVPAGRLSEFLQYSNTFALLLLISLIITAAKEELSVFDCISLVVFIAGIFFSGSRTVFILTAISVLVLIFLVKNKNTKIFLLTITLIVVIAAAVYAFDTGNFNNIGRFLTASLKESTFIGRILYWYDALPVILKHPFGTGYLGFYYLQQSIQTGLYSVRYVHNDFLQIILDIGWIPGLLLIITAVRSFFRKGAKAEKRLLIFVMSAHSFFDFDLQFIAVFMIFILLLDYDDGKKYEVKSLSVFKALFAAGGVFSIYMCVPLLLYAFGSLRLSHTLYPWNTDVNISIMTNEESAEKVNNCADEILKQNNYVTVAYSAKAAYAFSDGDFVKMIEYKDKAINNAPLITEEYEDYIYMLLVGESLYMQAGDAQSAEFCRDKREKVTARFYHMKDKISYLGSLIDDQPRTELSPEIVQYIKNPQSLFIS